MISRELGEGVAAWLMANRPVGFSWPVVGEQATGEQARPWVVVTVEEGRMLHRLMGRFPVTLRGEYLPKAVDDEGAVEQGDFPAGYAELVAVLLDPANFQSLRVALASRGLLLRKLVVSAPADERVEDETGKVLELGMEMTVQTGVPAGSAGG